jgi:hypothetical protein
MKKWEDMNPAEKRKQLDLEATKLKKQLPQETVDKLRALKSKLYQASRG